MSYWDDVHIKQRVEVSIEVLKKSISFGSTVVRKNDTDIYFPMPTAQQSAAAIRKDMPCEVTIHTEKGLLIYNTTVTSVLPGQPPTVQISRPPEDQLHLRDSGGTGLKVGIPITYRIMRDPVTPISDMKKGDTISIGNSDCSIHTVGQFKAGNYIEITLTLPKEDVPLTFVGIIEDCMEVKSGAQVSYNSYVKYQIIRPGDQDKIVKYIFNQQRILRKRGMY